MIACICFGIGEGLAFGSVALISCLFCWVRKLVKKHNDCECECHEEKEVK